MRLFLSLTSYLVSPLLLSDFGLVPVSRDPYLIGNYAGIAIAAFIGGTVMYALLYKQDRTEEEDNEIGKAIRDPKPQAVPPPPQYEADADAIQEK